MVYWCCIGSITATHNILHVSNVYMHNKENPRFIQIYAAAVRVGAVAVLFLGCSVEGE